MSDYLLYVVPQAWEEMRVLPGHIKQRVRRAIDDLVNEPRPPASRQLDYAAGATTELYRMRIEQWRIVYAIDSENQVIRIVAVRKRPPYDYQDLAKLLEEAL